MTDGLGWVAVTDGVKEDFPAGFPLGLVLDAIVVAIVNMLLQEELAELVVEVGLLLLARTDSGVLGLSWGQGVRSARSSEAGAKELLAVEQAFL
jgi:hypothetical protein